MKTPINEIINFIVPTNFVSKTDDNEILIIDKNPTNIKALIIKIHNRFPDINEITVKEIINMHYNQTLRRYTFIIAVIHIY